MEKRYKTSRQAKGTDQEVGKSHTCAWHSLDNMALGAMAPSELDRGATYITTMPDFHHHTEAEAGLLWVLVLGALLLI